MFSSSCRKFILLAVSISYSACACFFRSLSGSAGHIIGVAGVDDLLVLFSCSPLSGSSLSCNSHQYLDLNNVLTNVELFPLPTNTLNAGNDPFSDKLLMCIYSASSS